MLVLSTESKIYMGRQPFMVLLDTGGWTRWIPSIKSTSAEFAYRNKYTGQPETSISLNQEFETSYSGEKYRGHVVTDELWVGRVFPQFKFVVVMESTGAVDKREGYDGIIGMRRPPSNDGRCEFSNTTILDYIVEAGIVTDAIFTFRFCGEKGVRGDSWFIHGNLEFGGTRTEYYHPPIVSLSLYQGTQWVVDITSIEYGDLLLCERCLAYADTGSPDTYAPAEASNKILETLTVDKHVHGLLHVPAHKLNQVRPLRIKLASRIFTVPSQELTRFVWNVGFYHFAIQIEPDTSEKTWTLGVSLLRHFYLLFDQQNNQMGFAAVHQPGMRRFSWFVNGDLTFGGLRQDFHHLPIVYLPTYQSRQWMVYIDSIVYGDVVLCMPCRALLDTGTPGTRAPGKAIQKLLQNSVVEVYDAAVLHVPLQLLPNLLPITMNLRSHAFTLHPEQLVRPVGNVYAFAIDGTPDGSENKWLIGISFLRHFHTIFDQQNNRVGFAAVKC
ncbi:eukaryotic aspartyl protease [Opisthorchis viverrini]|uniref:Eukaryotic aspartyl protease n=1 Tax=Opisthorchis viverrini TaxID=6198 RepID=A0A1S8WW41_OPIVI|nr:eukaryotic aspartyl protease [Opisthorchis viverrini]